MGSMHTSDQTWKSSPALPVQDSSHSLPRSSSLSVAGRFIWSEFLQFLKQGVSNLAEPTIPSQLLFALMHQ